MLYRLMKVFVHYELLDSFGPVVVVVVNVSMCVHSNAILAFLIT